MLMDSPKQALKEYGLPTAAAFAPLLAYGLGSGSSNSSLAPTTQTGTLRPYDFNQGKPLYDPKGRFLGYSNSTYTALPTTPIYAAQGGIMGLAGGGQPLPPRMIKGGGTGLSDSVPARLTNGQPAALADGEFVVSADVVSALGEGSTDAGARKLYSMMDRVRKQAHGHKKQVRRVNDRKVLPA
jgi:hypothetical protein